MVDCAPQRRQANDPANGHTFALGINNKSQIVGTLNDSTGNHGYLEMTLPNPPPPASTTADMVLRASNNSPIAGQYEIYDIDNNAISAAYSLGQVGTDWRFVTLGSFFGSDTTDMLLRSACTGDFEVYDISNNNITAGFLGNVGLDWQVMGFGNFSSRGETDMILRNANNGGVEVYDINNNQLTGAAFLGTVGLDWQLGGFAAAPPTASMGSSSSTSQLVQAVAGFGGSSGASDSLSTVPPGAETSQQPLLTTPQHA